MHKIVFITLLIKDESLSGNNLYYSEIWEYPMQVEVGPIAVRVFDVVTKI